MNTIDQQTKLNLLIGYPLHHSKTPLLHNYLYKLLNLNYVLLAQDQQNLNTLIDIIKNLNVSLTAVTMPYKTKIIPFLDEVSEAVKITGATNTIIQKNGKLFGLNTDVDGIAYALRHISLLKKSVLIIGAGGAARALGFYLRQYQTQLYFLNRTSAASLKLASLFGGEVIKAEQVAHCHFDVIVNTTPLGMYPHVHETALPDYIFKPNQVVFDMVYHPLQTLFLKRAQRDAAQMISGLDMFIGQGFSQVNLLYQQKMNIEHYIKPLQTLLETSLVGEK